MPICFKVQKNRIYLKKYLAIVLDYIHSLTLFPLINF